VRFALESLLCQTLLKPEAAHIREMSNDPFSDLDQTGAPIDAQFEPAPAQTDVASLRSGGPGWIALAATGLAAALIGAVTGIYGADILRPENKAQKLLEQRLDQVAAVQAAIDEKLSEPAAASAELAGLISELDAASRRLDAAVTAGGDPEAIAALTARIDAIEKLTPSAPSGLPSADVTALTTRLASLEEASKTAALETRAAVRSSGERANAALALSAIEAAVRRGTGFEADYRALRKAVPDNDNVKRLAPYVSGVTALTRLQSEFPAVRAAVLTATTPETSGKLSWVDRAFGDAVSVRPANGKHAATTKALDAAAAALANGDLAACLDALAPLDAPAARAAGDWTGRAKRRITLEEALEDVRLSLADGLAEETEAGP
jgi:hypothetical protein